MRVVDIHNASGKADMETSMFRLLIALLAIIAAAFFAAWAMPDGTARQLFQITGAIVLLIALFLGSLALLQWLSPADSDSSP